MTWYASNILSSSFFALSRRGGEVGMRLVWGMVTGWHATSCRPITNKTKKATERTHKKTSLQQKYPPNQTEETPQKSKPNHKDHKGKPWFSTPKDLV